MSTTFHTFETDEIRSLVPGDLVFVKFSNMLPRSTPLILLDKYHDGYSLYFEVLDPRTGHKYHYQEHNLSEVPLPEVLQLAILPFIV